MITIHLGNLIVTFDSPEEAARYTALLNQHGLDSKPTKIERVRLTAKLGYSNSPPKTSDKESIVDFLSTIKKLPTDVSSGALAHALNLESVNGLGPRLRGLSKRFKAAYHQPLEKIIVRVGPPGQAGSWKIHKDLLENIG